ncbi:hypothetical protein ACXYMX_11845 [Sporosarcina sp. CAU 1771]
MRKLFIGIAITSVLLTIFLIYNHKQLPTKEGVFKITEGWSSATEEVYLVRQIGGEWLTIFRNTHSIMLGRLGQNWLGFWVLKDDLGKEGTLASSDYPPLQDEFNWTLASSGRDISYHFGQINNPSIKRIEVETKKEFLEDAVIISTEEFRFFYVRTEGESVMPVNITGFSETGELIYSTIKED